MRPSRIISSANWKYALGEVLLIVIGVTLALMATSWYESRQDRRAELEALQQIRIALESDLDSLNEDYRRTHETEQDVAEMLRFIRSGAAYDVAISSKFAAVTTWRVPRVRLAPYEQIKNRGFSLISNHEIRAKLVDLYESHLPMLRSSSENDQAVSRDQVLPYFYARFRRPDNYHWEPIDYATLSSDPVFENLLLAKQRRLQGYVLPAYEALIDAIHEVLAEIDREFDGAGA